MFDLPADRDDKSGDELSEPNPHAPVWRTPKEIMYAENAKPSDEVLEQLKKRLLAELDELL
ncbi:hypothetical protein [Paenibacillus sp. 22594]|uniref:hypothetical protein n=1 Tax=Paenibacillus sp. 22594 TaxID=3453947 RepID=UPI003F83AC32